MISSEKMLILVCVACYLSASPGAGMESNLDENKLRLIRGRRDENGIGLDSSNRMSVNEKTSNEYSTLYAYPSLTMESTASESSVSDVKYTNIDNENSFPSSYFEGKI